MNARIKEKFYLIVGTDNSRGKQMKDLIESKPTFQRKIVIGIILIILLVSSGPRIDSDLGHEWMVGEDPPLIIAHRGASIMLSLIHI